MPKTVKISIKGTDAPLAPAHFSIRLKYHLHSEPSVWYNSDALAIVPGMPGGLMQMPEMLQQLGIINKSFRWNFGEGHLVVPGNCLDGTKESIRLLWFLYGLESAAARKGGYVHFLPGKLEETHAGGSWQSEQPPYLLKPEGVLSQYAILFDGNKELARWLQSKNVYVKIGDLAVLQCGWYQQPRWLKREYATKKIYPILMQRLSMLHEDDLETLRRNLKVKSMLLVDAETGDSQLFKGRKHEKLHPSMPMLCKEGKWKYPKKEENHASPGNENLPG